MPALDMQSPRIGNFRSGAATPLERDTSLMSILSQNGRQNSTIGESKSLMSGMGNNADSRSILNNVPKKKVKKKRNPVTANLAGTRYEVVREVVERAGFTVSKDEDINSYLIWNDSYVSTDKISELKPYQRLNHFPGMGEICRKDSLARNMNRMAKVHSDEFNFVPKTWILPAEFNQFQTYARELKKKKKQKTFIIKPANGAMGNGISLCKNAEKITSADHTIVQEYMDKPYLIDGYKFDLRIYVVMTSCDPLKIFLYNDGLVRLATEKYTLPTDNNVERLYMHLTNYSVNKHSDNYDKSGDTDTGTKRTLRFLNEYLRKHDHDVGLIWKNITDVIIKTLIVAEPHVLHSYRMCRPGQPSYSDSVCFEILGFDIMLDRKLKPWLLEINRAPSFGTDEKLDYDIKSGLLEDTIRLVNVRASDKRRNMAAQKAESQKRLLKPRGTGSSTIDLTDIDKRKQLLDRRKAELTELLARIRKNAAKEEFENRNSNRLTRIFPPDDRFRQEKYANLIHDAFGIFLAGRATTLQKETEHMYTNKLKETDILDMLAQCEADEKEGKTISTGARRGPQPLQGMPESRAEMRPEDEDEYITHSENESEELECEETESRFERSRPTSAVKQNGVTKRPISGRPTSSRPTNSSRPTSAAHRHTSRTVERSPGQRSRSLSRPTSGNNKLRQSTSLGSNINGVLNEDLAMEEEYTQKTMAALTEMKIKFPGKTDEEAEILLTKLNENWKFHKPRIASYWLVKLDSIKRRKVIDIVRSNVRAVLQRTWKSPDIDSLRLYRIFGRVFNRLLWSHGQGLWHCFSNAGNSWETIFSKSTDVISDEEMTCCRRIVQLCQDCLLIVYQFATEAKGGQGQSQAQYQQSSAAQQAFQEEINKSSRMSSAVTNQVKPQIWLPSQTISQRISRLYQSRTDTLHYTHNS